MRCTISRALLLRISFTLSFSLETIIIANAQYWLDYLRRIPEDSTLADADLEGAARALDAVISIPVAWPLMHSLVTVLHPHIKRRGPWTGWDTFLHYLLHQAQNRTDQEMQLAFLTRLGELQYQYGAHHAAIVSYRCAWRLSRQINDRFWLAVTFSNLGDLYRTRGDFWRAEILCNNACDLFFALGDIKGLAHTENNLGLISLYQRRWHIALPHFKRAQRLFRRVNDNYGLAMVWQNLGVLYNYIQRPQEALEYLTLALFYYEKTDDEYNIAKTYLNIGNICLTCDDFERAEHASLQAEAIYMQLEDYPNLTRVRHNLGMIYTNTTNWQEAERCFLWAVEQWRNQQENWNLANTMGELAAMYIAWGQLQQAQHYLDAVEGLIAERNDTAYQGLWRELFERREKLAVLQQNLLSAPLCVG